MSPDRRAGWPLGRFVRARLHRHLFVWFGLSILLTGLTVGVVMFLVGGTGNPWKREVAGARTFLGGRFGEVWDDPARREGLGRALERDLRLDVTVKDAEGRPLAVHGEPCERAQLVVPVVRDGRRLGEVELCGERQRPKSLWRIALPLLVAGAVLWALARKVARRLARPIVEVTRVAAEIGRGRLDTRVDLRTARHGEVRVLADAINDMASRIQQQMADQRELLASVSHEIRTPLARIRLLAELMRDGGTRPEMLDELDREVIDIDDLVGQLLASSRLDFAALSVTPLAPAELGARAIERAGLDVTLLEVEGKPPVLRGDATVVGRALANLLDNAKKHGGAVDRLRIIGRRGASGREVVAFEVEDRGEGFQPGEEARVFESFYQRPNHPSRDHASLGLGLGLALVKRIAEVHGGRAYAENRAEGGARVGIELPVAGPPAPPGGSPASMAPG